MMQRLGLFVIAFLVISAVAVPVTFVFHLNQPRDQLYFGVTYGDNTVEGAKLLIDRVQNYTNVFVVDSRPISDNQTALDEVCSYAAEKNLSFFVYFFSLYDSTWKQDWVTSASQQWGDKFLGVYLRDEPGGRQIENAETVQNASSYSDAAEQYVQLSLSAFSMSFLKNNSIPVVTSDFVLYWFDFQGGFDCMFAELGWNNSRAQEIGLCRGAATAMDKDWGTIITWTYQQPPYLESGPETYQDMLISYNSGAECILVFDYYPQNSPSDPYGTLTDEHFAAMEQFWNYTKTNPRDLTKTQGEVALVLPKDYGWGMRNPDDNIWGLWPADNASATIWQNMNTLIDQYGTKLDIVYDGYGHYFSREYSKVYLWNQTLG
jgi:hypothetical protein